MAQPASDALSSIFLDHRDELLVEWIASQEAALTLRPDLLTKDELRRESQDFLAAAAAAAQDGEIEDINARGWQPGRDYLASLSRSRAIAGFSPSETATFVLSLKEPVFGRLAALSGGDATVLRDALWRATTLIDKLALLTTDAYLRSREQIIARQQQELLELSTPVVKLWDGVVAVPLIGTLDSARTQVVMENLLEMIVTANAPLAIIDITGVPTVDTLVAQHLLKTVAAARLMGADCIISGIRPQIAQTIVHLGVDLGDVVTKASLADAVQLALQRSGYSVVKVAPQG
jgi:rsbT co-antagonist protein RsbR